MHASTLHQTVVSARYILLLMELAEERGVNGQELIRGLGIDRHALDDPHARVSLLQHREVCLRAIAATGDESLGIAFGLRASLTTHGLAGFGLMTQPTAGDMFRFAERFAAPLQLPAWDLHFHREDGDAVLDAVETTRFAPLHRFACEQLLVSFVSMLRQMLSPVPPCSLRFDFPEPPYFARYRTQLPPSRFNCGVTQLRIPEQYLDQRPQHADALAARAVEDECNRELSRLDPLDDAVQAVHRLLRDAPHGYPDLPAIAAALHTTPRTLSRRLRHCGTSYRELVEEARRRDSLRLLAGENLSIAEIAARLGYASAANFSRAFQRWTGHYPGTYRQQTRRGDACASAAAGS